MHLGRQIQAVMIGRVCVVVWLTVACLAGFTSPSPDSPPVFTARRYVVVTDDCATSVGRTLSRVRARSPTAVVYQLLSSRPTPFTVGRRSGAVYARRPLDTGMYDLLVTATDGRGATASAPVTVMVGECAKKAASLWSARQRRAARPPLELTVNEGEHDLNEIIGRISLQSDERVKSAPVDVGQIRVDYDGAIRLASELNYEKSQRINASGIGIENLRTEDVEYQTVIVNVRDVDERPAFINGPMPYLAVINENAPPGYTVYHFAARVEGGDGSTDVTYEISGSDPPPDPRRGMLFSVDEKLGYVKTTLQGDKYNASTSYKVFIIATERVPRKGRADRQRSDVAVLDVRLGPQPPQFYKPRYTVGVPEDTAVESSVVHVQARVLPTWDANGKTVPHEAKLSLWQNDEDFASGNRREPTDFAISPGGVIQLLQPLDFEDTSRPRSYSFKVVAEAGGLKSDVDLRINVRDVNDNAPRFSQPLYTAVVQEDVAFDKPILTVVAVDQDEGANARVRYSISDEHFSVDAHGVVRARKRLDADQSNNMRYFIYKFVVTATDMGEPPLSTTAQVHVRAENTNDEAPRFADIGMDVEYVSEDARGNTPITTVVAEDPDKDQVTYSFRTDRGSKSNRDSIFEIDRETGLIKLQPDIGPDALKNEAVFNLTVLASDDGSCCKGSSRPHESTTTLLIVVKDVNNNKPEFRDCASYSGRAHIAEGKHGDGREIIQVVATDDDAQRNGQIVYSLYYAKGEARKPFLINSTTGVITPSPYVDFDREERPYEDVTVKATDRGERPLIGFCQFRVTVDDANDNAPQFDRASYESFISEQVGIGPTIATVFADDRDSPPNARIRFVLRTDPAADPVSANDTSYFGLISADSGEISVVRPLPRNREKFQFLVEATDSGVPQRSSAVSVVIHVRSALQGAPQWQPSDSCSDVITVDEDVAINDVFFECVAVSAQNSDNRISYSMRNGVRPDKNSELDFRYKNERRGNRDWVTIRSYKALDFEHTPEYNLTISAMDLETGVSSDKVLRVILRDKNDRVPRFTLDRFTGNVAEGKVDRQKAIITVQAVDGDTPGTPFSQVRYKILEGPADGMFRIDELSGAIYPTVEFDRERTDSFILDVEAEDGADSDLPGESKPNRDTAKVLIAIDDMNDNPPYFKKGKYSGEVRENAAQGQSIMTVKAHDLDSKSHLRYELKFLPHERKLFGVYASSGTVFVNGQLDYETRTEYDVTLEVTDGLHKNHTKLHIAITDVNDNAPVFDEAFYNATIDEEEEYKSDPLLVLHATDRENDAASRSIVYAIEGQGTAASSDVEYFRVDARTGKVWLQRPVDRDPPNGAATWHFIAQAIDDGGDGLVGYADVLVHVRDVNDNAPVFKGAPYDVSLAEERQPGPDGVYIATLTATDYDDGPNAQLTYSIQRNKEINGRNIFSIDKNGNLKAMMKLDHEVPNQRDFEIQIRADDNGGEESLKGQALVRVHVEDVNDNAPEFKSRLYEGKVAETAPVNSAVLTVSASDVDSEAVDNVFHYSIDRSHYFYMSTDPDSSGSFVGVLRVKKPLDFEDPQQRAGFDMRVYVSDSRHNASSRIRVQLLDENDTPPTIDGPAEARVREDAARNTPIATLAARDPDFGGRDTHTFRINRRSDPMRQFSIKEDGVLRVAKPLDREDVAQYRLQIEAHDSDGNMGSKVVLVFLEDVNDNAPMLETVPVNPVVMENQEMSSRICRVVATDPDTAANGPPFSMTVQSFPLADKFHIRKESEGSSDVIDVSLRPGVTLDREVDGKVILIPVQVADSGRPPMSAVRKVKIVVGDENDNPMSDGTVMIHVYNYEGVMPRSHIGRVFVNDLDDWDIKDKTFSWKDRAPGFALESDGSLFIEENKDAGRYIMSVTVVDRHRGEEAVGTVVVDVETISREAFEKSGSIRVIDSTAEDFVRARPSGESPYSLLRDELADLLNTPADYVQIFSVMPNEGGFDVRFAAHGSPYKPAVMLNGLVQLNLAAIEAKLGVKIAQAGIDECLAPPCDSCSTGQNASHTPTLLEANSTSFVGVTTRTFHRCGCPAPFVPPGCERRACLNNGVCHPTNPGFFCECRGKEKGARCQGKTISFSKAGFAWFEPIHACRSANISFEFMTSQANTLLFYNGPLADSPDYKDYIALELSGGKPALQINVDGHRENTAFINLDDSPGLNDNEWHSIDVYFRDRTLELIVDRCRDSALTPHQCRQKVKIASDEGRLNIVSPLQVGGLTPPATVGFDYNGFLGRNSFAGCIRNLRVNDELYDLGHPAYEKNALSHCHLTASQCEDNGLEGPDACRHGECVASVGGNSPRCSCDPGWHGAKCDERTEWVTLKDSSSFISYQLKNVALRATTNDVKLLFVPQNAHGNLMRATGVDSAKYILSSVSANRPAAVFQLGVSQRSRSQFKVEVAEPLSPYANQSYWLHIERDPVGARLSVDGLSGPKSAAIRFPTSTDADLLVSETGVSLGGGINGESMPGCVADYRFSNYWLPLAQRDDTNYASVINSGGVTPGCKLLSTCAALGADYCPMPFACVDFWKGPFCTCPEHMRPVLAADGTLALCDGVLAVTKLGISPSAVIIIIASLLLLMLLVLMLVVVNRRRRPYFDQMHPYEDMRRENIVNYGDEGGGEEDQDTYNIAPLRKPVLPLENGGRAPPPYSNGDVKAPPLGGVDDVIKDRLREADDDPTAAPFDELRVYGDGADDEASLASLSSLESADEADVDLDEQLGAWGPRFKNLADMYGADA